MALISAASSQHVVQLFLDFTDTLLVAWAVNSSQLSSR